MLRRDPAKTSQRKTVPTQNFSHCHEGAGRSTGSGYSYQSPFFWMDSETDEGVKAEFSAKTSDLNPNVLIF